MVTDRFLPTTLVVQVEQSVECVCGSVFRQDELNDL